ncbi:MAG: lipopolysaccharide heptosyltransferase II [Candidatus Omnitrophota bacterium]
MKKFLIINPFGVGDVLFTTPVISNIKQRFPESLIGYWCNQRVEGILKNNSKIDRIFALSRGDIKKIYYKSKWEGIYKSYRLYRQLQKERFDISLDYSLDHRYGLIAKLAGIKKRIGFNYKDRGRFLTDRLDLSGYSYKHVVEYYLDLLKPLNIEPKITKLDLSVPQAEKIKAKAILEDLGITEKDLLIGIAAGAGASWGVNASLKHWPAIKFAQLADKIIKAYSAKIIILGDAPERPIADTIINAMHHHAIDLTGKTSLESLIAIIDNLQVLVSNDGGPLHIAVALGKKTVSFFGPVSPKVYGPYPLDENRHIVLRRNLECSPCYNKFRLSDCLKNKECLEAIDVQEALEAVGKLL